MSLDSLAVESCFQRASSRSIKVEEDSLRLLLIALVGGGASVTKTAILTALGIKTFTVTNTTITIVVTGDDLVDRQIILPLE